jgi:PKD repeat protein
VKWLLREALLAAGIFLALAPAAAAVPPTASFTVSPESPHTLEPVTFTSTSEGDISSQGWDLDGEGGCDDATGATAQRTFEAAGTYRIALCVSGPDGEAAQSQNVEVLNQEPAASLIHSPKRPRTGEPVTFVSSSEDADGSITSQAWDLDADGEFDDGDEVSASRSFLLPGTYEVGLMVTDNNGAEVVTSAPITIRARMLAPFPTVAISGLVVEGGARIQEFEVDAPAGTRVRIRCRGPGCPARGTAARLRRYSRFERFLGTGAVIRVFVTKFGTIGKYTRFKVREGRPPARRDLCVYPLGKRLRKCPARS